MFIFRGIVRKAIENIEVGDNINTDVTPANQKEKVSFQNRKTKTFCSCLPDFDKKRYYIFHSSK